MNLIAKDRRNATVSSQLLWGVTWLTGVLVLSACSSSRTLEEFADPVDFHEIVGEYHLELPSGGASKNLYPIPSGAVLEAELTYPLIPRARKVLSAGSTNNYSVRRLGQNYWLSADIPPSNLWLTLKNFIISNRGGLEEEKPEAGVLASSVLEAEDGSQYRWFYNLNGGIVPGSAEVNVLKSSITDEGEELVPVEEYGDEAGAELKALLQYFIERPSSVGSLIVQALDYNTRVRIESVSGEPLIALQLNEARSWYLLKKAVKNAGFDVQASDDQDKSITLNYSYEVSRGLSDFERFNEDNYISGASTWGLRRLSPITEQIYYHTERGEYKLQLVDGPEGYIVVRLHPGGSKKLRRDLLTRLISHLS